MSMQGKTSPPKFPLGIDPATIEDKRWEYAYNDAGQLVHSKCKHCGKPPTPEGYDACIGELPGVLHACCGHGVEDGMVRFTNRKVIRGRFDK